ALGQVELDITPLEGGNPNIVLRKDTMALLTEDFHDMILVEYTRDLTAPVTVGESLATMYYFPEGGEPVSYLLTAKRSVSKRENAPKTLAQIEAEALNDPNPFPPITGELIIILLLILVIIIWLIRMLLRLIGKIPKKRTKLPKRQSRRYN
ncbi:MAG: hypothetical protein GX786_11010, partial [Clostridiales bacterium]|nr:hypothetical protein [Clostridiales bacterium]